VGDPTPTRAYTESVAREHGWAFENLPGELRIMQDLLDGEWDENRFLVVPPGHEIVPTVDQRVVAARPAC
jgi:hypothetical protein